MKVKSDFVTNSSSTCYVLALDEEDIPKLEELLDQVRKDAEYINEGVGIDNIFRNMKELKEYTNGGPIDWITKARGETFRFWDLDPSYYVFLAKIIIKDKKIATLARIDYGADYNLSIDPDWKDKIVG